MPSEYRRRSSFGLNLTPLIDIVFLLLVFFMLTAHFVEERAMEVELPMADVSTADAENPQAEIIIGASGELMVNGSQVEPDALEDVLRKVLHAPGPKTVWLRGDRTAHLELAVQAMDAANRAGARSLDIITRQP